MRLTGNGVPANSGVLPKSPLSRGWTLAVVIGALGLIFILDRASGLTVVHHLYYAPIVIAGVRFGYRGSSGTAAAAVLLYQLANRDDLTFRFEESDLVQMALFVAVGITSAKLADDNRRLRVLAMTDGLTGLHNLRAFEGRLRGLVRASRRDATPFALLVLDLDWLKSLNDAHGHLAGAEAVRTVGHIIAARLPQDAVACRYGGDEFVIAVPRCAESRARNIADDLRRAVSGSAPVLAGMSFPAGTLSISAGIACRVIERRAEASAAEDDAEGETLFRAADAALYAAKGSGRNRVVVAEAGTHQDRVGVTNHERAAG
jgi:diguanylate cyclase (GGDEF)-like protein